VSEHKVIDMAALIFILIVLALLVYGLERNHHRQLHVTGRLAGAGSTDAEDRDAERELADLRAVPSIR
jgi:hypothetical protein